MMAIYVVRPWFQMQVGFTRVRFLIENDWLDIDINLVNVAHRIKSPNMAHLAIDECIFNKNQAMVKRRFLSMSNGVRDKRNSIISTDRNDFLIPQIKMNARR